MEERVTTESFVYDEKHSTRSFLDGNGPNSFLHIEFFYSSPQYPFFQYFIPLQTVDIQLQG